MIRQTGGLALSATSTRSSSSSRAIESASGSGRMPICSPSGADQPDLSGPDAIVDPGLVLGCYGSSLLRNADSFPGAEPRRNSVVRARHPGGRRTGAESQHPHDDDPASRDAEAEDRPAVDAADAPGRSSASVSRLAGSSSCGCWLSARPSVAHRFGHEQPSCGGAQPRERNPHCAGVSCHGARQRSATAPEKSGWSPLKVNRSVCRPRRLRDRRTRARPGRGRGRGEPAGLSHHELRQVQVRGHAKGRSRRKSMVKEMKYRPKGQGDFDTKTRERRSSPKATRSR